MKVGDYVRFKDKKGNQYIRKITKVCNEEPYKSWGAVIVDKNANNVPYVSAKNIIKSSQNIIDLIEVGDYVNGMKIIDTSSQYYKLVTNLINDNVKEGLQNVFINNENEIKSIVTKEQFESMEYSIEE